MICSDPIENILITSLAGGKMLRTIEIKDKLEEEGYTLSTSQIYRKIKKLLDAYILIKKGGLYGINELWINSMNNLLQDHNQKRNINTYTLEPGQRKKVYAYSLQELDILSCDIIFLLTNHQKYKHVCVYNSHLYHILRNFELEDDIYGRFLENNGKAYFILGNDTPLDNFAIKLIEQGKSGYYTEISINKNLFPKEGYTLVIIGEYILEIFYPENITNFFNQFFYGVKDVKKFDNELYSSIFTMKTKCNLVIRRDQKEAERLVQIILHNM